MIVQVRPSGEEATAAAIRAIVSMVGIFCLSICVFFVSISVGIFGQYFCQYFLLVFLSVVLSVFLSVICIYFSQFFGTACFLDSIFWDGIFGAVFFLGLHDFWGQFIVSVLFVS